MKTDGNSRMEIRAACCGANPEEYAEADVVEAMLDDIEELLVERDNLLVDLEDSYKALGSAQAHTMADWPADTVIGEGGVATIAELLGARDGIGARLSNYRAADLRDARTRCELAMEEKRAEMRAKLAAKRVAQGESQEH